MDATELLLSPVAYMPPPRILEGLSAAQSEIRVTGASHSVVEILAHIVFWQSWFLDRCNGIGTPMPATASLGWPAATAADWEPLRQRFVSDLERAVSMVADDSARTKRVEPPIEFPPLANHTLSDAVTHIAIHNAHHLGQIVTLRQIIGAWPPPEGSWTW
jgi:uncharacterized damage-inducible protein DinB